MACRINLDGNMERRGFGTFRRHRVRGDVRCATPAFANTSQRCGMLPM
jgi:hypothetical protein